MGGLNVPGIKRRVPGTRNSQKPRHSWSVPSVPGVPALCARVRVTTYLRARAYEFFPARAYREHPEHSEQSSSSKACSCSGYPEQRIHTRNTPPMAKSLRETMPICTGFIDACREAFGAEEINAAIKAGMNGQQTFYASENAVTVGTKSEDRGVRLSEMVIGPLSASAQDGGVEK